MSLPQPAGPAPAVSPGSSGPLHISKGNRFNITPETASLISGQEVLAERFEKLDEAVDQFVAEADSAFAATETTRASFDDAKARHSIYVAGSNARGTAPDPTTLAQLDASVAKARARHAAADERSSAASRRAADTRNAVNDAIALLNRTPAGESLVPVEVKLPKGGVREMIAARHAIIAETLTEQRVIEGAVPPLETALEMARAQVVALGRSVPLRVGLGPEGARVSLPLTPLHARPLIDGGNVVEVVDIAPIVGAFMQEQLQKYAEEAIRRRYADGPLTHDASTRKRALEANAMRRITAEREEVAAILQAWSENDFTFGLRADTDPKAVLGIE